MHDFRLEINDMKKEMTRDGKARDERLQRMENQMKETEAQVGKNNKKIIDSNGIFGSPNFCNSTTIASDSNKFDRDEISSLVQNEIKKLNLESCNNSNISTDVS